MGFVRGFFKFIIGALLFILIPVSILGIWSRTTLLDTDEYVSAVSPLASDHAIQTQVSISIMLYLDSLAAGTGGNQTFTQQLIQRQYPTLRPTIEQAVATLLDSDAFQTVWETTNRDAHTTLVQLLRGEAPVDDQGRVTIDLNPVYQGLQAALAENGVTVLDGINPSAGSLIMPLFKYDDLSTSRRYVKLFDQTTLIIPIITLVLAVIYIMISRRKMRALFWLSLIWLISAVVVWIAVRIGKDVTSNQLSPDTAQAAAESVYDSVTRSLVSRIFQIGVVAVSIAVITYFASRNRRQRLY